MAQQAAWERHTETLGGVDYEEEQEPCCALAQSGEYCGC